MYYDFKTNDLIQAVLYNGKNKFKSWINYLKLLYKIKRISPDYKTLEVIYEFIDQLNFAYFYCLDDENKLFINDSRSNSKEKNKKGLVYKDDSVTITLYLKPEDVITLHIKRHMGYKETSITFENGNPIIHNELEQQLFINCTDLIMDELYNTIKKYRRFRRNR